MITRRYVKAIRRQNAYSTRTSKMASCTLLPLREIAKCSQVRQETSTSATIQFQLSLLPVDHSIFFGIKLSRSCGNITKKSQGWSTWFVARFLRPFFRPNQVIFLPCFTAGSKTGTHLQAKLLRKTLPCCGCKWLKYFTFWWHNYLHCVVLESIHASPIGGITPLLWKFQLSFIHFLILFGPTKSPPPPLVNPRKFQSL